MALFLTTVAMLLAALGAWGGLSWLVLSIPPTQPLAIAAFYLFAFIGISSTAALLAWAAVARASGRHSARTAADRSRALGAQDGVREAPGRPLSSRPPGAYVGHSMLLASISLFALWLQSLRMLSIPVGLLLLGLYVFLELALLFGTRGAIEVNVPSRLYPSIEP